jgi:hypothetical protein
MGVCSEGSADITLSVSERWVAAPQFYPVRHQSGVGLQKSQARLAKTDEAGYFRGNDAANDSLPGRQIHNLELAKASIKTQLLLAASGRQVFPAPRVKG